MIALGAADWAAGRGRDRHARDRTFFGAALAERRRYLNLSRETVAARCDMTAADLEHIEQGQFAPSPSQAWQLAGVLHLDTDQLSEWALWELFLHMDWLAEHVARTAQPS